MAGAAAGAGPRLQEEVPPLELWSMRGSEKDWCPEGHELKGQAACDFGYCDRCHREVGKGERILECKTCDWWMCYEPCYAQALADSLLPLGQALLSAGNTSRSSATAPLPAGGTSRSSATAPGRAVDLWGTAERPSKAPSEGGSRLQSARALPPPKEEEGSAQRAGKTPAPWAGIVEPPAQVQAPKRTGRWRLGGPPAPRAPPTPAASSQRGGRGQDKYGWLHGCWLQGQDTYVEVVKEADQHNVEVRRRLGEEKALAAAEERRWAVAHEALLAAARKDAPRVVPPAPPRPSEGEPVPVLSEGLLAPAPLRPSEELLAPTAPALAETTPAAASLGAAPVPAPTVPALAASLAAAPVPAPTVPALAENLGAAPVPAPTVLALEEDLGAAPSPAPTVPALAEMAATAEPEPQAAPAPAPTAPALPALEEDEAAPALAPMFPPAPAAEAAQPAAAELRPQAKRLSRRPAAEAAQPAAPAPFLAADEDEDGGGDGALEEDAKEEPIEEEPIEDPGAVTLTLTPGRHGIVYDPETGLVHRVDEGKQGSDLGVAPGWYVNGVAGRAVDGSSVNAALTACEAGSKPYRVSFRRDAVELEMALPSLDYRRLNGLTEGLKARLRRAATEVAAVPLHSTHVLLGPGESGTDVIARVLPRGHDAEALARKLAVPQTITCLGQAIAPLPGIDALVSWPLQVVNIHIEIATGTYRETLPGMKVPQPVEEEEVLDIDDAANAR